MHPVIKFTRFIKHATSNTGRTISSYPSSEAYSQQVFSTRFTYRSRTLGRGSWISRFKSPGSSTKFPEGNSILLRERVAGKCRHTGESGHVCPIGGEIFGSEGTRRGHVRNPICGRGKFVGKLVVRVPWRPQQHFVASADFWWGSHHRDYSTTVEVYVDVNKPFPVFFFSSGVPCKDTHSPKTRAAAVMGFTPSRTQRRNFGKNTDP